MKLISILAVITALQTGAAKTPAGYVNPFIGTEKMGHTYPGATVPFGMVQLSPDTDTINYSINGTYNKEIYKYCAGYQFTDSTIVGFSHTHFSGTGHSDLGDILIMPTTGNLKLNPGTSRNHKEGFRSLFSHENERAEPGYYSVMLEDYGIKAQLTATTRVGIHKYTFPKADESHIILDLVHGIYNYPGKNIWTFLRVENDSTVTGYRQTNGWGKTRTQYFAITFSKPFNNYGYKSFSGDEIYKGFWRKFNQQSNFPEMAAPQLRAYFDFKTAPGEEIIVKVALSPVSTRNALLNLNTEAPHGDFNKYRKEAFAMWESELGKIKIETLRYNDLVNFYTSLYHSFIGTTVYMDVNGEYKGIDQNVHKADGFTNYTTLSLWDTYRALHPLFNIVQQKRNSDIINSMLAHHEQSVHKMLPAWSHHANENWCMIGYHSVSLIADAIVKGIEGFNQEKALRASVETATNSYYDGLGEYISRGYVPEDKSNNSVSKTLEYAYDDWAIAMMAQKLEQKDIYNQFIIRSKNYRNLFDTQSGFMRPRMSDGTFRKDFDPLDTHGQGFIEGNAWNYSLYVPHEPNDLVKLMGGEKKFSEYLDSLFTMHLPDKYFVNTEDITREGIMGSYVHGNEPSHHIPYLYNFTKEEWKSQKYIREILETKYKSETDGLSGNDDCGQMSAWYIFSSLGFYPVAPGSELYSLGSPAIVSAVINLENGKIFRVETRNQSVNNLYVKRVTLNGKVLNSPFIKHSDIISGGVLVFEMSSQPI